MLSKLDIPLLFFFIVISFFSLVILFSLNLKEFEIQFLNFSLVCLLIFLGLKFNFKSFLSQKWFVSLFYIFSLFLLFITLFFHPIRGVRSWISFGSLHFQTSELLKISLLILYAFFFTKYHPEVSLLRTIFSSLFYLIIPSILIFFQPDFGAIIILTSIWLGFLFISGISLKRIFLGFLIFILMAYLSWFFLLASYQKQRIIGFIFPSKDVLGINYGTYQSKIAIGSAGFWGKGFKQGSQSHLGFLPLPSTDYIFPAFVEEWGIFGALILLIAYFGLIYRIAKIGIRSNSNWNKFICLGFIIILAVQIYLNLGSCLEFSPVVGVTLPFMSYGGSSFLVLGFILAIIFSINAFEF